MHAQFHHKFSTPRLHTKQKERGRGLASIRTYMVCTTRRLGKELTSSYQWQERAKLKDSTEALNMAAQEQAHTKPKRVRAYHARWDPRCRLGKNVLEIVQDIVAGCKIQTRKMYMKLQNQEAGIVYSTIVPRMY